MTVTIHVLDVSSENGYGDSTLISAESFDKRIDLIFDASYSKNLKKCNLSDNKFRYAFLTHYHEDHYGGFTDLLKNNQIRTFYMPDALGLLLKPAGPTRVCSKGNQRIKRFYYLSHAISSLSQLALQLIARNFSEYKANIILVKPYGLDPSEPKYRTLSYDKGYEDILDIQYSCRFPKIGQGHHLLSKDEKLKMKELNKNFGGWGSDAPMSGLFSFDDESRRQLRVQISELNESFTSLLGFIGKESLERFTGTNIRGGFHSTIRYFETLFHKKTGTSISGEFEFFEEGMLYAYLWRDEALSLSNLTQEKDRIEDSVEGIELLKKLRDFADKLSSLGGKVEGSMTRFGKGIVDILLPKKEHNNFGILARVTSIQSKNSILIPGDMDIRNICNFLDDLPLRDCKFIKASHHGSKLTHNSDTLIQDLQTRTNAEEYFVPNRRDNFGKTGSGTVAPCKFFAERDCCKGCCKGCGYPHALVKGSPHVHFSNDNTNGIIHSL